MKIRIHKGRTYLLEEDVLKLIEDNVCCGGCRKIIKNIITGTSVIAPKEKQDGN